jgi:hypothetical protein
MAAAGAENQRGEGGRGLLEEEEKGRETSWSLLEGGSRASSSHESDLGQQRAKAWVTTSPRTEKQFTAGLPGLPGLPYPMPAAVFGLRRIKHGTTNAAAPWSDYYTTPPPPTHHLPI